MTIKSIYLASALLVLLMTSACGAKNTAAPDSGSPSAGAGQESSSEAQVPSAGDEDEKGIDTGDPSGSGNPAGSGVNGNAAGSSDDHSGADSDAAGNTEAQTPADSQDNGTKDGGPSGEGDAGKAILIIIDQTPKPTTGNSFDFVINKLPEGYMLTEMQWVSAKHQIKNTLQEAIEHGQNGEDGFYISGDGQFMGFFYPDELKGEEGQVKFAFTNDQGKTLTWQKTITLK
ncbi:hypothetical protein FHS19_000348 [Paenibacillus rhizosphaerae]|uniref:DUF4352 domain-containing protein n=1 Tax=Paenibacillus rhizosphaerae TaxID=297318 RepID=A0A839TGI6_9BACL|nr:hypothetical protein [Paenibacillus rhizosphaerae]MBB3125694.1 hypothetical protein [Paenibacillus rhizosphaerae]